MLPSYKIAVYKHHYHPHATICPHCHLALLSTLPSHPHYHLVHLLPCCPQAMMLSPNYHLFPTLPSCPHATISSPSNHLVSMVQSLTHATISYPSYHLVPTLPCAPMLPYTQQQHTITGTQQQTTCTYFNSNTAIKNIIIRKNLQNNIREQEK